MRLSCGSAISLASSGLCCARARETMSAAPAPNRQELSDRRYAAALTPRSWRFTDAISRLRKRHCRPFLKAGMMLRRANSLTVSGLRSSKKATSREFSKTSSFSAIFPSKRRLSDLMVRTDSCSLLTSCKSSLYLWRRCTEQFLKGRTGASRQKMRNRACADTTRCGVRRAKLTATGNQVRQPKRLHADGGQFSCADEIVVPGAGHDDAREQTGENTDTEGDGEPLDRSGAELKQDEPRDKGRDIGVANRRPCALVSQSDRLARRLASAQFLPHPFIHQHVGIDRHSEGQHDSGDTGKGQRGLHRCHHADQKQDIQGQPEIRHDARAAIVDGHEDQHGGGANDERKLALTNRIATQRRADRAFLFEFDCRRQRTGPQHDGEIVRLVEREAPGNLHVASRNALLDDGIRIDRAVQYDSKPAAHIRGGERVENLGSV